MTAQQLHIERIQRMIKVTAKLAEHGRTADLRRREALVLALLHEKLEEAIAGKPQPDITYKTLTV